MSQKSSVPQITKLVPWALTRDTISADAGDTLLTPRRRSSLNIGGVNQKANNEESRTPPAIAVAKGGQKPPPAKISGRKPPKVVAAVDMM